ncbi:hypothetical protein Pint_11364 [Pistacia integerrima]|uniref:Uncharacterized protein n=1 Tax=Pistacia integerrima TaxID=434235 RepID=A0ACC0XL05_9ROSI|nr:hypothetical protein Pint_11364 [Pistacia integerrima]
MPFGIIHRCYFSFPTLLRRRLNLFWSRQAHVPDNKVELTEKVSGIDSNLKLEKCKGGQSMERSLSLHIIQDGDFATWRCFRANCGWAGQVIPSCRSTSPSCSTTSASC